MKEIVSVNIAIKINLGWTLFFQEVFVLPAENLFQTSSITSLLSFGIDTL